MDGDDARATLNSVLTSDELKDKSWEVLGALRENLAKADKEMARSTVIALALIALFELLRLGVVSDSATIGPIKVKQTVEVQLFVPPLVTYFVYLASSYRTLGNALTAVHRVGVSVAYPLLAKSNVAELLLPVSVDMQGFRNHLTNRRSARADNALGLWAPIVAIFGSFSFVIIAYVQLFKDGVNPLLGAVSLVVAGYYVLRAGLVVVAHTDTTTDLNSIQSVTLSDE